MLALIANITLSEAVYSAIDLAEFDSHRREQIHISWYLYFSHGDCYKESERFRLLLAD